MEKISVTVKDMKEFEKSKVPFIKNGGLFVPAEKELAIGTEVKLEVNLTAEKKQLSLSCKVVWVTPQESADKDSNMLLGIQLLAKK